jgi:uncharacterized membrane protein
MKVGDLVKKVVIWRCVSIFVTLVTIYVVTGDAKSATGITLLLHVLLTVGHYGFEQLWEKLYESR